MNEVNLIIEDIVMNKGSKTYKEWKNNPKLLPGSLLFSSSDEDTKNKMILDQKNFEISYRIDRLNQKIRGK